MTFIMLLRCGQKHISNSPAQRQVLRRAKGADAGAERGLSAVAVRPKMPTWPVALQQDLPCWYHQYARTAAATLPSHWPLRVKSTASEEHHDVRPRRRRRRYRRRGGRRPWRRRLRARGRRHARGGRFRGALAHAGGRVQRRGRRAAACPHGRALAALRGGRRQQRLQRGLPHHTNGRHGRRARPRAHGALRLEALPGARPLLQHAQAVALHLHERDDRRGLHHVPLFHDQRAGLLQPYAARALALPSARPTARKVLC